MSDTHADLGPACPVPGCDMDRMRNETACIRHVGRQERQIVCQHCGERGGVTTEQERVKRGISGGKATGAILTGGVSLLATGLARKEWITRATCSNCGQGWTY